MNRYKILAFILAAAVIVGSFSGCGKNKDESTGAEEEGSTLQSAAEPGTWVAGSENQDYSEPEETSSYEITEYEEETVIAETAPVTEAKPSTTAAQTTEKPREEASTAAAKTNTGTESKTKSDWSDISYVVYGELKYKKSKYYVSDGKLIAEQAGSKTTLSDQNCAENVTICNNEIYYTVIDSQKTVRGGGEDLDWNNCSCWKMKLDGSKKVKIFDYEGSGHVIRIDSKYIYYVGDTSRDDYYHFAKMQNGFFKYNKSTKQSAEIFTEGGLKYADPVYVGGKFLYSSSDVGFCRYDTKTERIKKLENPGGETAGLPQDVTAYDITTAYFTESDGILYVYKSTDDSVEKVAEIGTDCYAITGKGKGWLTFSTDGADKKFDLNTKTFI